MAAQKSNLSGPVYGYDFVLATTQKSINATLKSYLNNIQPEPTKVYYINRKVRDERTGMMIRGPRETSRDEVLTLTKGFDPLSLTQTIPRDDPMTKVLAGIGFVGGFEVQFGIPVQYEDPAAIPDIVKLNFDARDAGFTMICKMFKVVEASYEYGVCGDVMAYNVVSQSSDPTGQPYIIKANIDLRIQEYREDPQKLPQPVQNAIKNLNSSDYSIHQLLLDPNTAGLQSPIHMELRMDPQSMMVTNLQRWFLNSYMTAIKENGGLVLHYTIKHLPQTGTLKPTDLNFIIQPFLDPNTLRPYSRPTKEQADLSTLTYLQAVEGRPLPPPRPFNWNWITPEDPQNIDAIIAINRDTLTTWFLNQLLPVAHNECFLPWARVEAGPFGPFGPCTYTAGSGGYPDISIIRPAAPDPEVLRLQWNKDAYDCVGDNGQGSLKLINSYDASVRFEGNTVKVHIDGRIHLEMKLSNGWCVGDVSRQVYDETFTLGFDETGTGGIEIKHELEKKDLSEEGNFSWAAGVMEDDEFSWFRDMKRRVFSPSRLGEWPVEGVRGCVFPGGREVAFRSLRFSESGDLVCGVGYNDAVEK